MGLFREFLSERFGELASRVALETMFELARNATSWIMKFTDFEAQQIRQRVKAYVDKIQSTLQDYIQADPAHKTNLADKQPDVVKKMQQALVEWQNSVRASFDGKDFAKP